MAKKDDDEGPQLSPEEAARFKKAAAQLVSGANFLRWAANFTKNEISQHPRHHRVMMLSPMLSGRFAFDVSGDTLLLGVQPFEAVWLGTMPFERAYISDRLYLSMDGVGCIDSKLPQLSLGIFIDDSAKREAIQATKFVQPVEMTVQDGEIAHIGAFLGKGMPLLNADIIKALGVADEEKRKKLDLNRFF